jgi:integrase
MKRQPRLLEQHLGKDRTLESITEGDTDGYRRRLLAMNPFADVPCGPQANESRTVYVPVEDIEREIAVCPDNDWRLTFAMPRYAGIRFPSEFRELKWSDVDWSIPGSLSTSRRSNIIPAAVIARCRSRGSCGPIWNGRTPSGKRTPSTSCPG